MAFLHASKLLWNASRARATYYQQGKKFPPVFVRRFMLRYPNAHLWAVFVLCSSAMVGPVLQSVYLYLTMSEDEFNTYRDEKTVLVRERQKYGKNLWFPFLSSNKTESDVQSNSN